MFDWTDVITGHWLVIGKCGPGYRVRRSAVWRVLSKCGVHSTFTTSALAAGATLSCEACRGASKKTFLNALLAGSAGVAPPPCRVLPERDHETHVRRWEHPVFINTATIKSQTALRNFNANAVGVIETLLRGTALGVDYGWSVYVTSLHPRAHGGRPKEPVRILSDSPGQRRIEAKIFPAAGESWYEIAINTGRDGRWDETVRQVRQSAADMAELERKLRSEVVAAIAVDPADVPPGPLSGPAAPSANGKPAQPVVPAPAEVSGPQPTKAAALATALGSGVDRLVKMRSSIDVVVNVAREAQASAQMKADYERQLAEVDETYLPARAAQRAAAATADAADRHHREQEAAVRDARAKLAQAENELTWAAHNAGSARGEADRLTAALEPLEAEHERLVAAIEEADRLDAERVKAIGSAADVAGLLAALEKLTGLPA